jgi:hypothetical protein
LKIGFGYTKLCNFNCKFCYSRARGASFDGAIERAYLYSKPTHEVVSPYLGFVIDAKVDRAPEPPIKQRTPHTAPELWEMSKRVYEGEALNVVSAAFRSAASTKTAVEALNEFFSPLHERRLVLLMPDFHTKNVFTDRERWIITDEILEIVGKEARALVGGEPREEDELRGHALPVAHPELPRQLLKAEGEAGEEVAEGLPVRLEQLRELELARRHAPGVQPQIG